MSKNPSHQATGAAGTANPHPTKDAKWLDAPEAHDYPAAAAYLGLIADDRAIESIVADLEAAPTTFHAAKDLLRASELPLLPTDNPHVRSDSAKISHGKALSPVLLVRGDAVSGRPLVIADGYHRVCASYHANENTPIAARLVAWPTGGAA